MLSSSLRRIHNLKELSIDGNSITEKAADCITEVIDHNCQLEKLWLNNNKLKSAGINKITQALQHLNTLKLLQLDDNDIIEEAADGIAAVINSNPILQIRDQSILLFSLLFFFPAILFFPAHYAQYFAQSYLLCSRFCSKSWL